MTGGLSKLSRWALSAGAVLFASTSFAGALFSPMTFDTTAVLPKGVRNVRLTGFTAEITSRFDGTGNIVPVADAFNRKISFGKLLSSQPAGAERGQMKGGVHSLGISDTDSAGTAAGLVNSRVTAMVPVFGYGFTDKLTAGIALPILYSNTHVSTGWSVGPDEQLRWNKINNAFPAKIKAKKRMLNNVVATQVSQDGYEPLADSEATEVGDLTIGAKYLYYKGARLAAAIAPKIVLPTGRPADVNKLVDIAPGDGHASIGLGAIVDYMPTAKFTLTPSAGYIYQMPSLHPERIPLSPDESISPDVDESVSQKIGDIYWAQLGGRYRLLELWTLGVAYSFQYKKGDEYKGGAYDPVRYTYLSQNTEQDMHAVLFGLSYSTIPLFLKKKFVVPMEASLNFSQIFAGRNVTDSNLTSFDMAAYF